MVRSFKVAMIVMSVLLVLSALMFSGVLAQTPVPTPVPVDVSSLAAISAANGGQLKRLTSFGASAFLGFGADSGKLYYADAAGAVQELDVAAGKYSSTIPTSRGMKALRADGKSLTVLNGASVETWDVSTAQKTNSAQLENAPDATYSLHLSPIGTLVGYEDSQNNVFEFWDAATGKMIWTSPVTDTSGQTFSFAPNDKAVVLFGTMGEIDYLDAATGKSLWSFKTNNTNPGTIYFSPDSSMMTVMGPFGAADILDTVTGKVVARLEGDSSGDSYTNGLVYTPDGKTLWVQMDSGAVTAYDLTGKAGATIQTDTKLVNYGSNPVLSPDGSLAALQIDRDLIEIADITSSKIIGKIKTGSSDTPIEGVWFSPDDKLIAIAAGFDTVELWGVSS